MLFFCVPSPIEISKGTLMSFRLGFFNELRIPLIDIRHFIISLQTLSYVSLCGKCADGALDAPFAIEVYLTGPNPVDEPRPVLAVPLGCFIRVQDARDQSVLISSVDPDPRRISFGFSGFPPIKMSNSPIYI
jgi:hypothetical protein